VTPSPSSPPPSASRHEHARGPQDPEAATPWVWRSRPVPEPGPPLPDSFFLRDASAVARDLLGTCLRSTVGGIRVEGVVVETEAYLGPDDPASHAARRIGRTSRNETMYGPPGRAYVYRSYGIHWCLNVVTGAVGFPAAVLFRGLDPIRGIECVRVRRGGKEPLGAGPGRLGQGLGVTGALDGHSLKATPLELLRGWRVRDEAVGVSGRVGVGVAADWPLRFYLLDHPQVSPGPRKRADDSRGN
jgi:DNA-3-methyladenine glycosylase